MRKWQENKWLTTSTIRLPTGIDAANLSVALIALLVRCIITPSHEKKVHLLVSNPTRFSPSSRVWFSKSTGEKVSVCGRDACFLETFALPGLGSRMVYLKGMQDIMWRAGLRHRLARFVRHRLE
jgi:hypothetical protein